MHAAARVLGKDKEEDAAMVQRRFDGLVAAMHRHRDHAGTLTPAIEHFVKVTRSYRPGLFHCYAVRAYRAPTTTSSSCSARSATTNGVRRGARQPRLRPCCAARSA